MASMTVAKVYRSHREAGNLLKKLRLDIAVNDDYVKHAIEAVVGGAITAQVADGKILFFDLKECLRIRTGERGPVAVG